MDSRETVAISAQDIARASKFRIGDQATVIQSDSKPWTYDWPATEILLVWGIAVDRYGKLNITVRHDGDVVTDGFEPEDLAALRSAGTGRAEAEDELRRHWVDFCDADPTPDGFVERMEAAGFAELRGVSRDDLEDPFAAERGIYKGGSLWALTPAGHEVIRALPLQTTGGGDA